MGVRPVFAHDPAAGSSVAFKTWSFPDGSDAVFAVTITFEIVGEQTDVPMNPQVEMLPSFDIHLTARPVKPTVNYGSSTPCE